MTKLKKGGWKRMASGMGKIALPTQALTILAVLAALLPASKALGTEIDLTNPYPPPGTDGQSFATGTSPGGSGVIYQTADTKPAGTGVFLPFLSIQPIPSKPSDGVGAEQGYNTSSGGPGQGYLDTKRVPQWNHDLHVSDLGVFSPDGKTSYYVFELDANEKGNGNIDRLLSIDNIRIYTSSTDTASSVGNDISKLESLGTLRYAQNQPLQVGGQFNAANWVLIDASKAEGGSTSGSGSSDMFVLVPQILFAGAKPTDFVYFYNLNGIHNPSDSGFEEWRALTSVPDGGNTLVLLGSGLTALGFFASRRRMAGNA